MDRTAPSQTETEPGHGDTLDDPRVLAQRARLEARLFGGREQAVRIGRFALGPVLGAGAMGVVHRGHDEVLDRDIAIKLIPTRSADGSGAERLLREAQAMARVSHGNVVHVYEAGSWTRGVFVAMELVEGQTLREWLDGEGKELPWRERLDAVVAAGRGLAEAHRAGVVHRDFKPDNVLVGRGGEPKVTDFGLAGLVDASTVVDQTVSDLHRLACTATAVGTPLYMAPEVFDGRPADARSDQFGFCVVAYEAVYGRRPFDAPSVQMLRVKVGSGELSPAPAIAVERAVARAIARGLSVDPDERWPSMDALLAVLAPPQRGPGWRTRLGGGLAIGGLAVAATLWTTAPEPSPCGDGRAALEPVWSEPRRAALEDALLARGVPYAADTFERIAPRLDAYAEHWRAAQVETCEQQHRDTDSAVAQARAACLQRHRGVLDAAVERLLDRQEVDAAIHAAAIVDALPPVAACDDPPTAWPEDPEQRSAAEGVAEVLAEATVRQAAGEYERAVVLASLATDRVQQVDDPGLHAEAWLALGDAQQSLARYQDAERSYGQAQHHALRGSRWELAVEISSSLALASAQHGPSDAPRAHLDVARGLAERGVSPLARARLREREGAVHYVQGRYPEAIAELEAAVAAWDELGPAGQRPGLKARWDLGRTLAADGQLERAVQVQRAALARSIELHGAAHPQVAHGYTTLALLLEQAGQADESLATIDRAVALGRRSMPGHPDLAMAEATRAGLLMTRGRFDEAIADLEELRARWGRTLPRSHPTMLTITGNLGAALLNSGRVQDSEPMLREALEGSVQAYGAEHPKTATSRASWAASLQLSGRLADAEREYRAATVLAERLSGPRSAQVGELRAYLGGVVADQGRNEEAAAHYQAALSILEETLGAEHLQVALTRGNAATILVALGRLEQAEAEHEAVAAALERTLPVAHPYVINALTNLGDVRRRLGRHAEAIEVLERAVAMLDQAQCPPEIVERARQGLAEARAEASD